MSSACAPRLQHRLHRASHHAALGPDAPGVDGRDHAGARVAHQHRHAVGGHHRQRQSGRAGHQGVGVVDRGGARLVDHLDSITVDLVHPHHPVGAEADRGSQPGAVGGHRRRVVTDMVAEVEGVERRRRNAARPRGGHSPDANAHVPSIRNPPARCGPQRRMNGGTSTSSSSPPMFRVEPLVCTGTLTASTGSNSVELSLPAFADSMACAPVFSGRRRPPR